MARKTHKVATIQYEIKNLALDENHAKACSYIREAAAQGAELAVLPEYHLCGWAPSDPQYILAAGSAQKYISSYQALAKELNICLAPGTVIEREEVAENDIRLYNTAYFISNTGEILGSYRKKNIWHPERPHLTSSAGDPHEVIDTPLGKVGMLICWDLAFPEAFRELIAKGCEVVIIPTYWGRHDASPAALKLNPDCEALFLESTLTARCFENTCAVVFANAAGPPDTWLGMSRVVLPFVGPVKAMGCEEGFIIAELDMSVLDLAEENYKVRQDLASEGWHYSYRHDNLVVGEDKVTGR